jgi:hypothetical protein
MLASLIIFLAIIICPTICCLLDRVRCISSVLSIAKEDPVLRAHVLIRGISSS